MRKQKQKKGRYDMFGMETYKIEFLNKYVWINVYYDKDSGIIHYIDWEEDLPIEGKSFTPEEFRLMLENADENSERIENKFRRAMLFMISKIIESLEERRTTKIE